MAHGYVAAPNASVPLPCLLNLVCIDRAPQYSADDRLPIISACHTNGQEDQYGRCSIDVFGLNRQGLVEERAALLLELGVEVERIRELLIGATVLPAGAARDQLLALAGVWIQRLSRHGASDRRYSAVAMAFVHKARKNILQEFKDDLIAVTTSETIEAT